MNLQRLLQKCLYTNLQSVSISIQVSQLLSDKTWKLRQQVQTKKTQWMGGWNKDANYWLTARRKGSLKHSRSMEKYVFMSLQEAIVHQFSWTSTTLSQSKIYLGTWRTKWNYNWSKLETKEIMVYTGTGTNTCILFFAFFFIQKVSQSVSQFSFTCITKQLCLQMVHLTAAAEVLACVCLLACSTRPSLRLVYRKTLEST